MKDETLEQLFAPLRGDIRAYRHEDGTHWERVLNPTGMVVIASQAIAVAREHAEARARPLVEALERVLEHMGTCVMPHEVPHCPVCAAEAAIEAEQAHAEARREPREGCVGE
jgi:hypothetical protein